ncbi:MAG: glycosyltransferase [Methylococcaceae bacterium]
MNILILTSDDPYKDSGVVAMELLEGLRRSPENRVKLLVGAYGDYPDDDIIPVIRPLQKKLKKLSGKIARFFSAYSKAKKKKPKTDANYYVFDYDFTDQFCSTKRILNKVAFSPDVIIVLFMTRFLSFKNLYELNTETDAAVFLYFMDMAPMTGACHYAWDCKGYTGACNPCPAFLSQEYADQAQMNLLNNQKYIEKTNLFPIAATQWQLRQIQSSVLYKDKKMYKILLPINDKVYCPADKQRVRKELGLPLDKRIVFFGAVHAEEKRKGAKELIESLNFLKKSTALPLDIHLAIAGKNIEDLEVQLLFPFTRLGYLDHAALPKAYQAADIFVSPSIEDSGPMMVNQSIMSGTPVVAFDIGVSSDLVHTNKTGYRANFLDTKDFARGIEKILELNSLDYQKMSNNCRELGLERFTHAVFLSGLSALLNENKA